MNFSEVFDNEKKVAIVGAGVRGKELIDKLALHGKAVDAIMDNSDALCGKTINGIDVQEINNLGTNYIYVITPKSTDAQIQLQKQLVGLQISEEKMLMYDIYEYYKSIYELGKCKEELSFIYLKAFAREINWENPSRYTEILNWEKVNIDDPLKTLLVDKVKVRDWVKEKIGEKYLIKRYFECESIKDIDFDILPKQFVIKANNGSGRNIIVKDKRYFNENEAILQLTEWMSHNYAFCNGGYEIQYKDVVPQIICEEYLEGVAETVYDYNIYCFHGKPKYIWCIKGSHRPGCQASFYDTEWNMQSFSFGYPKDPIPAPKPQKLDEMLALSEILCKDFKHVRVDWYNLPDGRVLFGEMTFSSWSGLSKFQPDIYDDIFGELILNAD